MNLTCESCSNTGPAEGRLWYTARPVCDHACTLLVLNRRPRTEDRCSDFIVTNFGVIFFKTCFCGIRFDVIMSVVIQFDAFRVVTPFCLVDLVLIHGVMIQNTKILLIITGVAVFVGRNSK
jgi:hypothetical protein